MSGLLRRVGLALFGPVLAVLVALVISAVVIALIAYNGSVLAEVVRAGYLHIRAEQQDVDNVLVREDIPVRKLSAAAADFEPVHVRGKIVRHDGHAVRGDSRAGVSAAVEPVELRVHEQRAAAYY